MGRNLTPTAILDAKGSFIAHPSRERDAEPKADRPLGSAPKWLTKEEKAVWKRLAKELLPGVAFESDRTMFALVVVLTNKLETRQAMKAAECSLLLSLASRFAMTPADRSRVTVEKPKESTLAQFLSRKAARQTDATVQ